MKKATLLAGLVLTFSLVLLIAAQSQTPQGSAPTVKVGPALTAKAAAPAPGTTAKNKSQKASIGKGPVTVKASGPSSFWTEEVDVDADGVVETNDFLYDAGRGVLYTYREDDFTCKNGKPESGSILAALYAKGNKAGKPVGSGWYVVNVNKGQCASQTAGTFGCKFDANGNATECGAATINNATGELDVVVVK